MSTVPQVRCASSRERHPKDLRPPVHDRPEIRFCSVSKRFGSLWANREISFDVHRAEIHAIVGENGAGKSTLMKLLCGHFPPDEGFIALRGRESRFRSPRQAAEAGLGLVSQQPHTFPQLTALENVLAGHPPGLFRLLRPAAARTRVEALCSRFGFELPFDQRAGELAFAHRQQIQLLRVLYRDASVLVLDEPTSLLAPPEAERLLDLLRGLRFKDHTVLFVSHRLSEVLSLADRVSVLSKGRCVGTYATADVTRERIARLIAEDGGAVGSPPADRAANELGGAHAARLSISHAPVVEEEDRAMRGPAPNNRQLVSLAAGAGTSSCPHERSVGSRGTRIALSLDSVRSEVSTDESPLDRVSLELVEGESFGVGGVVGNGQRSLARVVSGLEAAVEGGIHLAGEDVTRMSLRDRRLRGLRWLPANLTDEGMLPAASLLDNCLLGLQREMRFQRYGWLRSKPVSRWASAMLSAGDVRHQALGYPASSLSGGNLQKLGLCRALEGKPRVVLLEQPSRGLDLLAQKRLRSRVHELRAQGVSFLVISHDLEELFELCDRIGVLFRGALMGVQNTNQARRETLVRWMLGGP